MQRKEERERQDSEEGGRRGASKVITQDERTKKVGGKTGGREAEREGLVILVCSELCKRRTFAFLFQQR